MEIEEGQFRIRSFGKNEKWFMLVCRGLCLLLPHPDGSQGMVISASREALQRFMATHPIEGAAIAEIGTVKGETLEGNVSYSHKHGANCVWSVDNGGAIHKLPVNENKLPEMEHPETRQRNQMIDRKEISHPDIRYVEGAEPSSLYDGLVNADIITAIYLGKEECLWKRPMGEGEARQGYPARVMIARIPCSSKAALRKLKAEVKRLKYGD